MNQHLINRKHIITTLVLFFSVAGFAQENEDLYILETDSTWSKEIIKFPIKFARKIVYEGFEDLRFPSGWAKQDSPEFWSYVWVWSLDNKKEITEKELESDMQFYFDGLMGLGFYKINEEKVPKTNAIFIKKENTKDTLQYVGRVKTFDTRFLKKPMTLNILVDSFYCEKENKAMLVFRLSPMAFENQVWNTLKSVKLKNNACLN